MLRQPASRNLGCLAAIPRVCRVPVGLAAGFRRVAAVAGKTSTLRSYAEARPGERFPYVAFNAAVARETRASLRAHQAARALGLNPAGVSNLTAADQALVVLRHFLSSDASDFDEFGVKHRYRSEALAILRGQPSRRVYVGDPHQQIYQFRYAINGMADAGLSDELCLSESFRYGPELAAAANRLLALKGETRLVRGGRRGAPSTTKAFIARGNVAVYRHGVELAARGGLGAGSTGSRGHFAVYGPQIQRVGIRGGDAGR